MSSTVRNYAKGAAQSVTEMLAVANFLAPTVEVATMGFRYWEYDDKRRFVVPPTRRAIGGDATQINTGGSPANGLLEANALDYPIDEQELAADEDAESVINEGSDTNAQIAGLSWEKEVVDMALAAAGAGDDINAAPGSGEDLIDRIDAELINIAKVAKCGSLMNMRLLFGPSALRRLKNHASTKGRIVAGGPTGNGAGGGQGGGRLAVPTDEELMALLMGKPQYKLTWTVYDTKGDGVAESMSFLMDNAVLIFAAADAPTRRDPSFMKTFRLRNKWMVPGSYQKPDGRGVVLKHDWFCLPKVTNSAAVKRLNLNAS